MHILLPTSPLQYAQQRLPLPHRHPPYSRTKTHHTHLIAHEIASAPSAPWATRSSPRSLFHQTVAFLCRPAARRWLNPHGPTTCERRARGTERPPPPRLSVSLPHAPVPPPVGARTPCCCRPCSSFVAAAAAGRRIACMRFGERFVAVAVAAQRNATHSRTEARTDCLTTDLLLYCTRLPRAA